MTHTIMIFTAELEQISFPQQVGVKEAASVACHAQTTCVNTRNWNNQNGLVCRFLSGFFLDGHS